MPSRSISSASRSISPAGAGPGRPAEIRAQVVTCIDVRSERLRRHLERADDNYKTHRWAQGEERLPEPPSFYYHRQIYSCFFKDSAGMKLLDEVGVDERVDEGSVAGQLQERVVLHDTAARDVARLGVGFTELGQLANDRQEPARIRPRLDPQPGVLRHVRVQQLLEQVDLAVGQQHGQLGPSQALSPGAPLVERQGGKLTLTAIALKIVAAALREFPKFNASLAPDHPGNGGSSDA
mgnify:CR=1 FL=1